MNKIIRKEDVTRAHSNYLYAKDQRENLVKSLKSAESDLRNVRKVVNDKAYQSYKAQTTVLRKGRQLRVEEANLHCHTLHQIWQSLLKAEIEQNQTSNKQKLLESALMKLTTNERDVLRQHWIVSSQRNKSGEPEKIRLRIRRDMVEQNSWGLLEEASGVIIRTGKTYRECADHYLTMPQDRYELVNHI